MKGEERAKTRQREFQAWAGGGHYPASSNVPCYRETHLAMTAGRGDIFSPSTSHFNQTTENSETNMHLPFSLSVSRPLRPSHLVSLPFPVRVTHGRQLLSASDLRERANGREIKMQKENNNEIKVPGPSAHLLVRLSS